MELDKEVKRMLIDDTKAYLTKNRIPYRYITIRDGLPVIIVDYNTFDRILNGDKNGGKIVGRFIAQGERGWSGYCCEDGLAKYNIREKMTEYQATCFVIGQQFGRKPRTTRFATGVIS